jgi:F0F1-type ATP synthase assembly protein I
MSNVLLRGKRLVVRIVLLQAGCAVAVASVYFMFGGSSAGVAAMAGGLMVAAGTAVLGWRAFRPGAAGAATLGTAMYTGVALKWLWFALALYVAFARLRLDVAPFLVGMVAAQLANWAALIRLK